MSAIATISIEHVIVLLIVNFIGIMLIGVISYLAFRKTPTPKTKLITSIGVAFAAIVVLILISVDFGIYLWVKSGNLQSVLVAIPLSIGGALFLFPIVTIGTYIQLSYREKIQEYTNPIIKKHTKS